MARLLPALLASACVLWIDLHLPLGVAVGVLYVPAILLVLRDGRSTWTCPAAAAASLLVLLGWKFAPAGGEAWKVAANRLLSIATLWLVAFAGLRHRRAALARTALLLAHDLRSPLSSVVTAARTLAKGGLTAADRRRLLAALERESGRLNGRLDDYLKAAGPRPGEPRGVDLDQEKAELLRGLSEAGASPGPAADRAP